MPHNNDENLKLFENNESYLKKNPDSQFSRFVISDDPLDKKKKLIIEDWFSDFPDKEKNQVKCRFLSKIPGDLSSPFFELAIYQLLFKLGFNNVEYEPDLKCGNSTNKKSPKPDYLIKCKTSFIIDALQIFASSNEDLKLHQVRMDTIRNLESVVESLAWKDICIIPKFKNTNSQPIRKSVLKKEIEKFFVNSKIELPFTKLTIKDDNEEIQLYFYPKKQDEPINQCYVKDVELNEHKYIKSIQGKIKNKAKKFKYYNYPLVLAINISGFCLLEYIEKALFGTAKVNAQEPLDGIWGTKEKSHCSNLIGVLVTRQFYLETMLLEKDVTTIYYPNPYSDNDINKKFNQLTVGEFRDGKINYNKGKSIQELLKLV